MSQTNNTTSNPFSALGHITDQAESKTQHTRITHILEVNLFRPAPRNYTINYSFRGSAVHKKNTIYCTPFNPNHAQPLPMRP